MISDACPQLPPTICMKLIHVVSNSRENFRCVAPCSFFSMTAVSFKKSFKIYHPSCAFPINYKPRRLLVICFVLTAWVKSFRRNGNTCESCLLHLQRQKI